MQEPGNLIRNNSAMANSINYDLESDNQGVLDSPPGASDPSDGPYVNFQD